MFLGKKIHDIETIMSGCKQIDQKIHWGIIVQVHEQKIV